MKNQKGFSPLIGIIIVIAVALVAIGGVFGYQYFTQPKDLIGQPQDQNTENTTDNVIDQTAGWKTYKNTEYGFEFKYPSKWIENGKIGYKIISVISPENKALAEKTSEGSYYYIDLEVSVCDNLNSECAISAGSWFGSREYISIQEFVNDKSQYKPKVKSPFMPEVSIDGVKGYGVIVGGLQTNYEIMLEYNNKIYLIDFPSAETSLTDDQQKILSTFKFTK